MYKTPQHLRRIGFSSQLHFFLQIFTDRHLLKSLSAKQIFIIEEMLFNKQKMVVTWL